MENKTCKKCGHLCHCVEADHEKCDCANCDCNGDQAEQATYERSPNTSNFKTGEVIIDDSDECESCQ